MSTRPIAKNGHALESVWDYPRPPAVEPEQRRVRVLHEGLVVAESDRALRVLETASPPGIYLPPEDVARELLESVEGHTVCEWKGLASYFDVVGGGVRSERAAWTYPQPNPDYTELRDYIAFNAGRIEGYLGEERVRPQPGQFYGGWITDEIEGPVKGEPGSEGW